MSGLAVRCLRTEQGTVFPPGTPTYLGLRVSFNFGRSDSSRQENLATHRKAVSFELPGSWPGIRRRSLG